MFDISNELSTKTIIFESDNLDSHSRGYSLFYSNKIFSDGVPSNSTEFV